MLIAKIIENDQLIQATQANNSEIYYCPGCKARVQLKKGNINIPHFAHINESNCDVSAEGETVNHLQGKLALFALFIQKYDEVRLEPWLSQIKQRPDLMVRKGMNWFVIEFQCAPISLEKVQARTSGYRQLNYKVIWILGENYQRKRLQARTFAKFTVIYQQQLQVAFWQLTRGLFWQAWWQLDGKSRVLNRQLVDNQPQQLLKLQQAVIQAKPEIWSIQNELYKIKRLVIGIPWECHPQYPLPGGLKVAQWQVIVRVLLTLEKQPRTMLQLLKIMTEFPWQRFGCISVKKVQKLWLNYLLDDLMSRGLIKRTGDTIVLARTLKWFNTYQEKLQVLLKIDTTNFR
ncbi:competence protein CoiA [Weissella hellenica]|uniref:competence protein CoiA n=1 Tax=Weissella hellenica TaxID=46256 RepID=UPI003884E4B0